MAALAAQLRPRLSARPQCFFFFFFPRRRKMVCFPQKCCSPQHCVPLLRLLCAQAAARRKAGTAIGAEKQPQHSTTNAAVAAGVLIPKLLPAACALAPGCGCLPGTRPRHVPWHKAAAAPLAQVCGMFFSTRPGGVHRKARSPQRGKALRPLQSRASSSSALGWKYDACTVLCLCEDDTNGGQHAAQNTTHAMCVSRKCSVLGFVCEFRAWPPGPRTPGPPGPQAPRPTGPRTPSPPEPRTPRTPGPTDPRPPDPQTPQN